MSISPRRDPAVSGSSPLDTIKAGRVSLRRETTSPSAPDFYRYVWLVDGQRGSAAPFVRLTLADPSVVVPSFAGLFGPAEQAVTYRDDA